METSKKIQNKEDINPKDIFYKFPDIKADIEALKKENNSSKLGKLMVDFIKFMTTSMAKYTENNLKYIEDYLIMMPIDIKWLFVTEIDKFERPSPEFQYIAGIHYKLYKQSKKYIKEFYDPIMIRTNQENIK